MEDQGLLGSIRMLGPEERLGVIAPVSQRVQMVGCVIAIIEAVAVALQHVLVTTLPVN